MKKNLEHLKLFLLVFVAMPAFPLAAQEFTVTTTNANIISSRTLIDFPGLSGNSDAIIIATPLGNSKTANPHPIGAWYYAGRWNIFNSDHAALVAGLSYKVQYFLNPGPNQFLHLVTRQNLGGEGSYIDNPMLNNNPKSVFAVFQNHSPDLRQGSSLNRYEIKTGYSTHAGKWYITNIDGQPLFPGAAYNVVISSTEIIPGEPVKANTEPLIKEPKKPIESNSEIIKKESKKPIDNTPVIGSPIDDKDFVPKKPAGPSYDFSKLHVCIETDQKNNLPARPPVPPKPVIPKIKSNGDLEAVSTITQSLSGYTDLMWTAGDVITVGFTAGSDLFLKGMVMHYVKEWETYANITFNFVSDVSTAQIKVGFEMDNTSWSWLGRNILVNPNSSKTMNFGWLTIQTAASEFRRVILHEFGHALGFVHEHQSPNAGIPWDIDKVYAFYTGEPNNWDTTKINNNIFARYSKSTTNSSAYDPSSIMHYPIDAALTTDGSSVPWNYNLSPLDRTFVREVYPFPSIPPTSTGVLNTGDDCDEIEFSVEYNVVHPTEVEFVLVPGRDHHNALVNWWKMIGITNTSGGTVALFLNTTKKMQVSEIDKTKAITFGKAKILGVHTGLTYTWSPWPAIVGGCRVKFVWRRDSCN